MKLQLINMPANELGESGVRIKTVEPGSTQSESFVKWQDSFGDDTAAVFEDKVAQQYNVLSAPYRKG